MSYVLGGAQYEELLFHFIGQSSQVLFVDRKTVALILQLLLSLSAI